MPEVYRRLVDVWASLEPAWRECFLLAWESFQARSVPVGAVLVDGSGRIIGRGRNRRNEKGGPGGWIGGGGLAHAELCTAALRQCHVGAVRFAGPDPMWFGVDRLPDLNRHVGRWWARREGPLGGPFQSLAVILHLIFAMENDARSIVDSHAEAMPDLVRVARRLAGSSADGLRVMTLLEALHRMENQLRQG